MERQTRFCLDVCLPLLQKELIGHEKERKGDEKRRRALHAEWLAQQDEQQVQQLMDGVRNGFRRRKGPAFLQDDVRTLSSSQAHWANTQSCMLTQFILIVCGSS